MPPQNEEAPNDHYDRLKQEYGFNLTDAQHALVYSKAYQDGHAYGYSEVEGHYRDLVEFAEELLKASP